MKNVRSFPSTRFAAALRDWNVDNKAPVIAEIKLRSPKVGALMDKANVPQRVEDYERGGAACLSVVTGSWYGGDLELLRHVRELTRRPLLRKDFITSRKAIDESIDGGADAVLLTQRLMSPETLGELAAYALHHGVAPFVEIADRQELARLNAPPGIVLAINNRDIRVRECDDGGIARSIELHSTMEGASFRPAALVSASGIERPEDVDALLTAGFDAALIATALARSGSPVEFLRMTRDRSNRIFAHPPEAAAAPRPAIPPQFVPAL